MWISTFLTPSRVVAVVVASFTAENLKEFIVRSRFFDYSSKMTHDPRNYLALLLCAIFISIITALTRADIFAHCVSFFSVESVLLYLYWSGLYTCTKIAHIFRYKSNKRAREKNKLKNVYVFVCMRKSCSIHWTEISAFFTHDLHSLHTNSLTLIRTLTRIHTLATHMIFRINDSKSVSDFWIFVFIIFFVALSTHTLFINGLLFNIVYISTHCELLHLKARERFVRAWAYTLNWKCKKNIKYKSPTIKINKKVELYKIYVRICKCIEYLKIYFDEVFQWNSLFRFRFVRMNGRRMAPMRIIRYILNMLIVAHDQLKWTYCVRKVQPLPNELRLNTHAVWMIHWYIQWNWRKFITYMIFIEHDLNIFFERPFKSDFLKKTIWKQDKYFRYFRRSNYANKKYLF